MPEATPFQVMIVDDHPLMRRGVRQLLELDPGFEVVAEAGDGASAIDLANRLDIDVILLDLNMKGMSGLDTLNALRRDGVTAQIIILTVSDASSDVFALIDAGADAARLPAFAEFHACRREFPPAYKRDRYSSAAHIAPDR